MGLTVKKEKILDTEAPPDQTLSGAFLFETYNKIRDKYE